ncbi:MAG: hypothetical protein EOO25_06775 [Comamonadaceae bacterium]|nr:MAG: hypothetical protein EOO25_06775 [Comamonadaceae bacterium]
MSYILDALRKADAQRERDPARGIHAQPVRPAAGDDARSTPAWVWLLAGGAAVCALAAGAWLWTVRAAPPAAPVTAMNAPRESAPVPIAPPPMAPAAPAMEVLPAAPPPAPAPEPVVKAAPAPARLASAPVPASAPAATPAAAPASAQKAAAPAPERLPSLAELPADVQRELPKLAITGGVYSENPAQRMLVINGQVFNEGGEPAPGVLLEQIRPRSAVLKIRGARYTVAY